MWKYKILLSYVGTLFCGWQRQKGLISGNLISIQATLEDALFKMTGESVSVVGSGRTDAGVHALGQVAHFRLSLKCWNPDIIKKGLNSHLPIQIRIIEVDLVPMEFHAQRSAIKKQYSYYFQQGPCPLPHLEPYSWWIQKTLNQEAMQTGINILKGEKNFLPFQASGSKKGSTVRTLFEAEISHEIITFPGYADHFFFVRVRLLGSGFLKQMVRGIVGTLLQVGENRRNSNCFQEILELQDRQLVGPTAPGRALWLEKVWYN